MKMKKYWYVVFTVAFVFLFLGVIQKPFSINSDKKQGEMGTVSTGNGAAESGAAEMDAAESGAAEMDAAESGVAERGATESEASEMAAENTEWKKLWTPDFTTSNDYGTIYPFVSGIRYKNPADNTEEACWYYYGLVDENGNVIEDACYTKVEPVLYRDMDSDDNSKTVIYPYWKLGRYKESQDSVLETRQDDEDSDWDYDEYDDEEANTYWCLAALDGSFATECKYQRFVVKEYGVSFGNLPASTEEEAPDAEERELYFLDKEGILFLTGKDIDYSGAIYLEGYGESLFTVITDDGTWFMNEEGEFVLGPYLEAHAFREGRAVVSTDDGEGIIDNEGNWVIEPGTYNMLQSYHYGYTTGQSDPDTGYLLDRDGNVIVSAANSYFLVGKDNYYQVFYEDYSYVVYGYDGTEIRRGTEMDWEYSDSRQVGATGIWYSVTDQGTFFENRNTGASISFDGEAYADLVWSENTWDDEWEEEFSDYIVIKTYDSESEEWKFALYDTGSLEVLYSGASYITRICDPFSDTYLIKVYMEEENNTYLLVDEDGKEICTTDVHLEIYDNNFLVVDAEGCSYYDSEGNEWFSRKWK